MTPLEITALLRLHCYASPLSDMPQEEARSNAMWLAYKNFERWGLLVDGVTRESVADDSAPFPRLSKKGSDLVTRLCEVAP